MRRHPLGCAVTSVLFAVVATACWLGALRLAARMVGSGWERPVCALVLLGAGTATVPVVAGVLRLGTSPASLAALSLAAALVTAVGAGRARTGVLAEIRHNLRGVDRTTLLLTGAAAGCGLAHLVHSLVAGEVRTDQFHLAEVVRWIHDGTPGSVEHVVNEWPAGAYPLANELILTWGVGIARSFSPVAFWTSALSAVFVIATYHGLRLRDVPAAGAALATGSGLLLIASVTQLEGAGTDLPAIAWLAAGSALVAAREPARRHPLPALLALGLAVGTKTNTALLGILLVLVPCWACRRRARPAEVAAVTLAAALALAWPLRNLVLHGSPLWPFSSLGGLGDPVPYVLSELQGRFATSPRATVAAHLDEHPFDLVRVVVPLAGVLAVVAIDRRGQIGRAAAVTALAFAVWAVSPLSGATSFGDGAPTAILHYLLPVVTVAVVTLALAWRRTSSAWPAARVALVLSGLASATMLWRGHPFDSVPTAIGVIVGGSVTGALAAAGVRSRGLRAAPVVAATTCLLAAGTAWAAGRYTTTLDVTVGPVLRWLAQQPEYRRDERPVVTNWGLDGRYSGPRLRHPIVLMPPGAACSEFRSRAADSWLIVYRRDALGRSARFAAGEPCVASLTPAYRDGFVLAFRPGPGQ